MEKVIVETKKGYSVEIRWGMPRGTGEPWKEKTHLCTYEFGSHAEADAFLEGFSAATSCFAVRMRPLKRSRGKGKS
jgi:hypothetical protein